MTPEFAPALNRLGLTNPRDVFVDERVRPWRTIAERQNCVLDFKEQQQTRRFHIKRFAPCRVSKSPAEQEAAGIALLQKKEIPTVQLVGWGALADHRSFIILDHLEGFQPADKVIAGGLPFGKLSKSLAHFVARLHDSLHHRDLYLCHLFVHPATLELRLIDAGRVKQLPGWPLRRRWIVKDLAQLCYSMSQLGLAEPLQRKLIEDYAEARGESSSESLCRAIVRKRERIRRHDQKLNRRNPERNVTLSA